MIRRPPRSTLFPTRRSSDLIFSAFKSLLAIKMDNPTGSAGTGKIVTIDYTNKKALRSEEHTSELQSLAYLVCRLLLEKKKYHLATFLTWNTLKTEVKTNILL